ncbi:MAG TPA: S8 family serine peptidase, partial [Pyrinomonadaceae bacterium]|nr:S8 family serine peptidase [Pyrinomonadaceae bacterium]
AAPKISPRLKPGKHRRDDQVSVILELNSAPSPSLGAFLKQNGVQLRRQLKKSHIFSVSLPFHKVAELSSYPEVFHISTNEPVNPAGHVTATTGADAARAATAGVSTTDGAGIGIAIVDSGIDTNHVQFSPAGGPSRVVASVDFTGENRTDDPYGHGTFVAAAAAGNDRAGASYMGIAPAARLLNVRVLNSFGVGSVESVLAGLDWIATHALEYNIRIVNLSLGGEAVESYKYDPLCRAVRRLTNSGIIVFAAAGNDGKDLLGNKIFGAIHTPANEPSAFTIGAVNTFQTDQRADDKVATYSSRGPTRSYDEDANGVRHHDNLIKPDLVAPGNKLVFAEAFLNRLVFLNPTLHVLGLLDPTRKMMQMSGTSVATPIAAGSAALMLQINPKLTPNMVKALMQYSAQKLDGFGTLEQGAGMLNVEGAVKLAGLVRTDLGSQAQVGTPLLTGAAPAQTSSFASSTFSWSGRIVRKFNTMSGTSLITRLQGPYFTGELLGEGFLISDGLIINRGALVSGTTPIADGGAIWANGAFAADGVIVSQDPLMTDAVHISSQSITLNGDLLSDPLMQGERHPALVGSYDGIIHPNGIVLSTGATLNNGTLISGVNLTGDGILIGTGELVATGLNITDSIEVSQGYFFSDGII